MGIFFMANMNSSFYSDVDRDNMKAWEIFISGITLEWLLWNECDHTVDKLWNIREEAGSTWTHDISTYSSYLDIRWQNVIYSFHLPLIMESRTLPLGLDCRLRPLLCLKTMDEFIRIRQL